MEVPQPLDDGRRVDVCVWRIMKRAHSLALPGIRAKGFSQRERFASVNGGEARAMG